MSGIYIHIPFCRSKCIYCDFFSTPRTVDFDAYIAALLKEYHTRRHEISLTDLRTVYIGGGTPSSLPVPLLRKLIQSFRFPGIKEFTVELNPDDLTPEMAQMLADESVNRISMGAQSMVDAELRAIGRRHNSQKVRDAVDLLHNVGINNISLDLIYGLPGQTLDSWHHSISEILALSPHHISAYSLMFEEGTALWSLRERGKISEAPQELTEDMYRHLCTTLRDNGYTHYEISNFAIPGYESCHNSSYWDFTPYLGLGPGAHSFDGLRRRFNPPNIADYISAPESFTRIEDENDLEIFNDYIMVSLRRASGVDIAALRHRFGNDIANDVEATAADMINRRQLTATASGFRIDESKWLIADSLILPFIRI